MCCTDADISSPGTLDFADNHRHRVRPWPRPPLVKPMRGQDTAHGVHRMARMFPAVVLTAFGFTLYLSMLSEHLPNSYLRIVKCNGRRIEAFPVLLVPHPLSHPVVFLLIGILKGLDQVGVFRWTSAILRRACARRLCTEAKRRRPVSGCLRGSPRAPNRRRNRTHTRRPIRPPTKIPVRIRSSIRFQFLCLPRTHRRPTNRFS